MTYQKVDFKQQTVCEALVCGWKYTANWIFVSFKTFYSGSKYKGMVQVKASQIYKKTVEIWIIDIWIQKLSEYGNLWVPDKKKYCKWMVTLMPLLRSLNTGPVFSWWLEYRTGVQVSPWILDNSQSIKKLFIQIPTLTQTNGLRNCLMENTKGLFKWQGIIRV